MYINTQHTHTNIHTPGAHEMSSLCVVSVFVWTKLVYILTKLLYILIGAHEMSSLCVVSVFVWTKLVYILTKLLYILIGAHEMSSLCVVSGEDWEHPRFFEHQVRVIWGGYMSYEEEDPFHMIGSTFDFLWTPCTCICLN
jgi:hypothetical protein